MLKIVRRLGHISNTAFHSCALLPAPGVVVTLLASVSIVYLTDAIPDLVLEKQAESNFQSPDHQDVDMTSNAIALYTKRRTQYALGRELPISEAEVEALVRQSIRIAPSAFNSQSSRAVILFGAAHEHLWSLTRETLRPLVPADAFASTDAKMTSFAAGAGTVLFFEDHDVIEELQKKFPLYADAFPVFSEHSAGMAQFAVWTALAEAGIGASLQHYNPLIDVQVAKRWSLPASWKLRAQMPFGSNLQPLSEKTFIADEVRFRTFR